MSRRGWYYPGIRIGLWVAALGGVLACIHLFWLERYCAFPSPDGRYELEVRTRVFPDSFIPHMPGGGGDKKALVRLIRLKDGAVVREEAPTFDGHAFMANEIQPRWQESSVQVTPLLEPWRLPEDR